jgi:2-methylaconitate cis-trans-isomerase PrpF
LFPTGQVIDTVDVPDVGAVEMTLINAGNPTIFMRAARLGLQGTELQGDVNAEAGLLKRAEAIRAQGAVVMGLVASAEQATTQRPHTPKLVFVAAPRAYLASDGKHIEASDTDLLARSFSMGLLHHAMPGTSAVAIAVAAAIPGTLVNQVAGAGAAGRVRFGHPSGVLSVGAEARPAQGGWIVTKAVMSRSARRLMEGVVLVPQQ